jgi:alkyl hydroperoxide reductase subunit AhpC
VGVKVVLFSLDHTQTHAAVGRTSLDEGSARRRDFWIVTDHKYASTRIRRVLLMRPNEM